MQTAEDLLALLVAHRLGIVSRVRGVRAAKEGAAAPLAALVASEEISPEAAGTALEAARRMSADRGGAAAAIRRLPVELGFREELLRCGLPAPLATALAAAPAESAGGAVVVAPAWAGRYAFGEEIGRGGIASVVEAEDRGLSRVVAVKLAPESLQPIDAERFAREAKLTAKLDHPNIVPVYDFGEAPGADGAKRLYYAMKRIRGRDLRSLLVGIKDGEAGLRETYSRMRLLAVFQDICQGVAFAHSKGVIHRDLKPANVMLGGYGEVLIVDWGLARERGVDPEPAAAALPAAGGRPASDPAHIDTQSSGLTLQGDVLGTPAFMAPEQAAGRNCEVDERSDIYALGGILFQILTLEPPRRGLAGPGPSLLPSQVPGLLEPVPPDLEAIVMKAMAVRKSDRYASVTQLHHEVQLFLEGVKERQRRRGEAMALCEQASERLGRFLELDEEIERESREARLRRDRTPRWLPFEQRRPVLEAVDRVEEKREERLRAYVEADSLFGQALAVEPGNATARDGRCRLIFVAYLAAERRRLRQEMVLQRARLGVEDTTGEWRRRLEAPGRVTIRAFAWSCECRIGGGRKGLCVEFGAAPEAPWRDGRPCAGQPLRDEDFPVPSVRVAGGPAGHRPSCPRREVEGLEIVAARYVEREMRLVLEEERPLGRTPVVEAELPQGSWLCTVRGPAGDVRVPIRSQRAGRVEAEATILGPGELPEGFALVSRGSFRFGELATGVATDFTVRTADVAVARFPVTCEEYLEFLNDLCASGRQGEAAARSPRDLGRRFWVLDSGRFRLPTREEDPNMAWQPSWPAMAIDWHDALAYCAWRSARDGRLYTLLHEQEFERAVRGADSREFAWGDRYDESFSHASMSLRDMSPLPVGSFPVDESPYGVRDTAGGVATWCLNASPVPFRALCVARGGSWSTVWWSGKAHNTRGNGATVTGTHIGLRLAWRPVDEWSR